MPTSTELPDCFDVARMVCHECDQPLTGVSGEVRLEVTVHDESGYHPAGCSVCSSCASLITQPVDPKGLN